MRYSRRRLYVYNTYPGAIGLRSLGFVFGHSRKRALFGTLVWVIASKAMSANAVPSVHEQGALVKGFLLNMC